MVTHQILALRIEVRALAGKQIYSAVFLFDLLKLSKVKFPAYFSRPFLTNGPDPLTTGTSFSNFSS